VPATIFSPDRSISGGGGGRREERVGRVSESTLQTPAISMSHVTFMVFKFTTQLVIQELFLFRCATTTHFPKRAPAQIKYV
jgi:hypothetical protein